MKSILVISLIILGLSVIVSSKNMLKHKQAAYSEFKQKCLDIKGREPYCYYIGKSKTKSKAGCDGLSKLNQKVSSFNVQLTVENLSEQLSDNEDVWDTLLGFPPTTGVEVGCSTPTKPTVSKAFQDTLDYCKAIKSREHFCYYAAYGLTNSEANCKSLEQLNTKAGSSLTANNFCNQLENNEQIYSKLLGYQPSARLECGCTTPDLSISKKFQDLIDDCQAIKSTKKSYCYVVGYGKKNSSGKCDSINNLAAGIEGVTAKNFCDKITNTEALYNKVLGFSPVQGVVCDCSNKDL